MLVYPVHYSHYNLVDLFITGPIDLRTTTLFNIMLSDYWYKCSCGAKGSQLYIVLLLQLLYLSFNRLLLRLP